MAAMILLVVTLVLVLLVVGQLDNVEQAKTERVYAEASLVRAQSERARASAEATGILMAVMMPYAALAVASIFGLALIGLVVVLARRPAPQQNIYILPRGAYPDYLAEPKYISLPEPDGQNAMIIHQSSEWSRNAR